MNDMTKKDFLDSYREAMGVELTWADVLCGLVVIAVFMLMCAFGELF